MLIFESSVVGRRANNQAPQTLLDVSDVPASHLRTNGALMPEVSELETVRHYTRLSQSNFSIDTNFYPLGSCTMKYNPRGVHRIASLPNFLARHPYAPVEHSQGILQCLYDLQAMLADVTGMSGVSLVPMAGAQGELAGAAMIHAYHRARGDMARVEFLVPDAAHGTNPASAVKCGFKVREIPTAADGDIDLQALSKVLGPQTAGIMLTNPSTLGVFDRDIKSIAKMVHEAGGLLYYDGANLNAILSIVRPGDMGFDVMHMNMHKTFATPHGGGGPGSGPVAVAARLLPFLPIPMIGKNEQGYYWLSEKDCPQSIGRMSAFMGNAGILLRAYAYARLLGREGMKRVALFATLNANYLMKRLSDAGYQCAYPQRRASHEFIISLKQEAKHYGVNAMDVAKRLLDYGFHAPTAYFPLLIPECLLIEPTETESKQELDRFVNAMISIRVEMNEDPELLNTAPHTMPIKRLDDVKAARDLDLKWRGQQE